MKTALFAGWFVAVLAATPVAAGDRLAEPRDIAKMQQIGGKIEREARRDVESYLRGEPDKVIARLSSFDRGKDWHTPLVLGNMTWLLHPEESFAWTRQALERGGGRNANFELALHYTRREDCEQALQAWSQVSSDIGGYYHGIVAYCHFKLGQDAEALAAMDRFEYGHPGRFESLLEEIWGGRPALGEHAYLLADYKAGRSVAIDELMVAPFGLDKAQRAQALLEVISAAAARGDTRPELAELSCLKPALAADAARGGGGEEMDFDFEADRRRDQARAADWKATLQQCGLLIGDGRLPMSAAFARQLLLDLQGMDLLSPTELLSRQGETLASRAHSTAGDFEALDLLAALQSSAKDRAGVAASDQFGWHRYHEPRYAVSALLGEMLDGSVVGKDHAARVRAAFAEFPDDGLVAWLATEQGDLPPAELKRALRTVILAEFHHPSEQQILHYGASARRLFEAIGRYRKLLEAERARST